MCINSDVEKRKNIYIEPGLVVNAEKKIAGLKPHVRSFSHYLSVLVALDLEHGLLEKYPGIQFSGDKKITMDTIPPTFRNPAPTA